MFLMFSTTTNRSMIQSHSFASQDTISPPEPSFDQSNSPSMILKRRVMNNVALMSSRPSSDRLATYPSMNSSNGLNELSIGSDRENLNDSPDVLPFTSKAMKPVFDPIPDLNVENAEPVFVDDQREMNLTPSTDPADDRRSVSSEKARRQALANKLFKPFQNLRLKKKTNA